MLCQEGGLSSVSRELVGRARRQGVTIHTESEREMRRMSGVPGACELIALEGPGPETTLGELMSREGLVLWLVGLRYPGNVGFILRSAEVAGASGVVMTSDWGDTRLEEAFRVGIRAHRFLPVVRSGIEAVIEAANEAGRPLVALETSGTRAPWELDWTTPRLLAVGSEASGLPATVLDSAAEVLRIPSEGFIPSYNVQAAVAMVLGERLRQLEG
ncbi:MAG TPA: TrmH family RNA methyltransferase [Deltaproteobacteria bacterium]|nr:TrmH family RNA methyltransferase [Deltaproteobacteria bacterium]